MAMLFGLFFLPLIKLGFYGQRVYSLTGFDLVFTSLDTPVGLVGIPILTRILTIFCTLSLLFAGWMTLKEKRNWATMGFVAGGILLALSYACIANMQDFVQSHKGLGHLVYTNEVALMPIILICFVCGLIGIWKQYQEKIFGGIFFICASLSILSVLVITGYIVAMGTPAMQKIGVSQFLFSSQWQPGTGKYGIGAMIVASLYGTAGAILIGVPIGVFTAIFFAELAPKWLCSILRPCVQVLAGIPSVIYGFFGLMVMVPGIQHIFHVPVGDGLLSVIIILSIMVLPTIVSISETALRAVPSTLKEASLAVGATHIQSIFKVVLPAARSGVLAGVILGVGRAIGETMAIIMVCGNIVQIPGFASISQFIGPVRPMTAGIALEMSYSQGLHRQALFAIGLVLFVFIILINLAFRAISKKAGAGYEA